MIPSAFVFLKTLPLNTSGKLDRKALPPPSTEPDARGYVGPGTPREQLVATAFAQVLGLARVSIHDSFFDLGGHSLMGVRLIAELSRLTGKSLSLPLLFEHPTVAQLAQALEKEAALRLHKTLVLLHPAESRTPLFCVHPVGGHVLCYVELASSFQPPQQVYGLQATPVAQAPAGETLGEVASRYVTAIQSVQPHGPYQLLGWSLGGVLAFEMARQLKRAGEEVALLALLDAYAPDPNLQQDAAAYSEAEMQRGFLRNLTGERLSESDAEPFPDDVTRLQRALLRGPSTDSLLHDRYEAQLAALYALFRRNVEMERSYRPDSYDGRVLLLRAAERPTTRSRDCGWGALCTGELEIVDVPGDHYTLLSSANQAALAKLIEERLLRLP
jgi:thioesterase domain-containing protein/acyl carrier protein